MRKIANLPKQPFPQTDVVTKVVPAPTDGWDALSPLALMDPKRAPILTNWTPRPGWVELRAGTQPWANTSNTSSPVETLMVWRGPSTALEIMFAAVNDKIYNVSTQYAPTLTASGFTNNRWQYVNFGVSLGGTYLMAVNGSDRLQYFDGTTWSAEGTTYTITFGGALAGYTSANISNIYAQKQRVWFMLNNPSGQPTSYIGYLGTQAIQGAVTAFDLGALFTKGGYIVAMADWTIDGGSGPNDYACFISSKGQLAVFQGTDPSSASTWALVGVFNLPPPIGRRCFTSVGSDVAVITLQGVLPLSSALPFDPSADRSVAITSRIQNQMATWANSYSSNFGWQVISYPLQQLLILNVPTATNSTAVQGVMNSLTGAWAQYTGWNANCFEIFNNNLYWGDNFGNVMQAYLGSVDVVAVTSSSAAANPIAADMQCAFNYFDDPGRIKRMTMVQPLLTASGNITPTLGVDADFATSTFSAPVTTFTGGSLWDVAIWDVNTWPSGATNIISWLSVEVLGHALAIHMKVNFGGGVTTANGVFDIGTFDSATFDSGIGTTAPILYVNAFNAVLELGGFI